MMDTRTLARALGGVAVGRNAVAAPGPGHSLRDRSLSVRLDPAAPDGFLVHSHAGDDWRVCRDYVRRRLGLHEWQPGEDDRQRTIHPSYVEKWDLAHVELEANEMRQRTEDDLKRIDRALAIWNEGIDPRGTLAERYLKSRALKPDDYAAGRVLRFHSHCPWRNENTGKTDRIPALIAAFRSIDDDEITGIHRIALRPDGTKIDRRMLGIVYRAAVKLDPAPTDTVIIGEGIETCLAARQLGLKPAWALGSVGAISRFPVFENVDRLIILGEHDDASARAISLCGARWRRAGKNAQQIKPDAGCGDLNDELLKKIAKDGNSGN